MVKITEPTESKEERKTNLEKAGIIVVETKFGTHGRRSSKGTKNTKRTS
jgi:hypothetical protein